MALLDERCLTNAIKDHNGTGVQLVWHKCRAPDRDTIPPFPFQVYILQSAQQCCPSPEEVGKELCLRMEEVAIPYSTACIQTDRDCQHRLEVYPAETLVNVLSCVEHQRAEVTWRNRTGIWPRLVSQWDDDETGGRGEQLSGLIVVIDSDAWREEGLLLVSFDPARYETRRRCSTWNFAGNDPAIVRATRVYVQNRPYQDTIQGALSYAWRRAGHVWMQSDLARRNAGGFSPALYPAVDPAAHEDAEAESEEDAGAVVPPPLSAYGAVGTNHEAAADDDDDWPLIRDSFHRDGLWMLPTTQTPRYRTATYSDTSGRHTVSVWDKKHSLVRPRFVYTLYCGSQAVFAAESLFHCLNKGLLAAVPWTLDVKRGFDTISEAFGHHGAEQERRTEAGVQERQLCMQMILSKVNQARLPVEVLDYLAETLVPPMIPGYFGIPNRPFDGLFLYLNAPQASRQAFAAENGPLMVYFRPSPLYDGQLLVRFMRFWHRVSDEMHTIWSLAAPRAVLDVDSLPRLMLRPLNIEIQLSPIPPPEAIHFPNVPEPVDILRPRTYSLTLRRHSNVVGGDRPIIIDTTALAIGSTTCCPLELFDAVTNLPLPPGHAARHIPDLEGQWWQDSWSHSRSLGFRDSMPGAYSESYPCFQLDPGCSREDMTWPSRLHTDWQEQWPAGTLMPGREYVLRLKPGGFVTPRWTFGTLEELRRGRAGPFNLPPLRVEMQEVRFVCRKWVDLVEAG